MLDDLEFEQSRFPRILTDVPDMSDTPEYTGQGDFDINSLYVDDIEAYDVFRDGWGINSELNFH